MTQEETREKLLKLKVQIEALSPAARLLVASQIMRKDPDLAIVIAENVVLEHQAASYLGSRRADRDDAAVGVEFVSRHRASR